MHILALFLFYFLQTSPLFSLSDATGVDSIVDSNFTRIGVWQLDSNRINGESWENFLDKIEAKKSKSVIITIMRPDLITKEKKGILLNCLKSYESKIVSIQLMNEIDVNYPKLFKSQGGNSKAYQRFYEYVQEMNIVADSLNYKNCFGLSFSTLIFKKARNYNIAKNIVQKLAQKSSLNEKITNIDFHNHYGWVGSEYLQARINKVKNLIEPLNSKNKLDLLMTESSTWTTPKVNANHLLKAQSELMQANYLVRSAVIAYQNGTSIINFGVKQDREEFKADGGLGKFSNNGLYKKKSIGGGAKISAISYNNLDSLFTKGFKPMESNKLDDKKYVISYTEVDEHFYLWSEPSNFKQFTDKNSSALNVKLRLNKEYSRIILFDIITGGSEIIDLNREQIGYNADDDILEHIIPLEYLKTYFVTLER